MITVVGKKLNEQRNQPNKTKTKLTMQTSKQNNTNKQTTNQNKTNKQKERKQNTKKNRRRKKKKKQKEKKRKQPKERKKRRRKGGGQHRDLQHSLELRQLWQLWSYVTQLRRAQSLLVLQPHTSYPVSPIAWTSWSWSVVGELNAHRCCSITDLEWSFLRSRVVLPEIKNM